MESILFSLTLSKMSSERLCHWVMPSENQNESVVYQWQPLSVSSCYYRIVNIYSYTSNLCVCKSETFDPYKVRDTYEKPIFSSVKLS